MKEELQERSNQIEEYTSGDRKGNVILLGGKSGLFSKCKTACYSDPTTGESKEVSLRLSVFGRRSSSSQTNEMNINNLFK